MKAQDRHNGRASALGSLLRKDRETAGLSLSAYAALVGVSRTYLSRLERGVYVNPSSEILTRIAVARGLRLADVFCAAGLVCPDELPSFMQYVQATHPDWPEEALQKLETFYLYVKDTCSSQER